MRSRIRPRYRVGLAAFFVLAAAMVVGGGSSAFASGNAGYTTFDVVQQGCNDGPNGVDCNNYDTKDQVYANGGPTSGSGLDQGTYYFSVLVPGYQHDGFIDGNKGNLSDTTSGGTAGDVGSGDAYTNREFSVDSTGAITWITSHNIGTSPSNPPLPIVQLMPYDDTSNGGGVYILALCRINPGGYPPSPRDCKFDAFRVKPGVTTPPASDLTVSKTVTHTFTREFPWTITKTACLDGTGLTGQPACVTSTSNTSGTAKFNYIVKVTKGTGVDSAWDATGVITITNPNGDPVSGVNVSDQITYLNGAAVTPDPNAGCTITAADDGSGPVASDGTNQTIPAHGAVDYTYDCPYTSGGPAANSETNTASATWPDIGSDNTSASFDVPFSWGDPSTVIHNSVTVSDVITSTVPSSLPAGFTVGAATPGSGLPDGSTVVSDTTTYNYSRTLTAPHDCLTVNNKATFNVTDPDDGAVTPSDDTGSATATAQVCRTPANTGALTMGYWQNKNGQAIISGQAKTGTCPSATYLRQFPPFQDLSATATCAQVAAYDVTIFKAATCSGPSTAPCNAMLKAQMLATAFDVYFSAPITNTTDCGSVPCGGNKINAPAPIGGVSIDLTQICKMIDGSGGTATCSGTYQNVSGAFGGATHLTVLQMLTYAGSQSNVGGSDWYGDVKATQVLAKDAFDAINNKVAFTP